jgi:hypothetical protein
MQRTMVLAITMLLATVTGANVFAQENMVDVRGTWVGDTDFPGTPGKDHVILVLKRDGTKYTGTITVGETKDAVLEKLEFKDEDSFNFEFNMVQGGDKLRISVKLDYVSDRILGNKLMGAWGMESGEYGILELELKK